VSVFLRRSSIAAPAGEVFRWHSRPGAFQRLTPPWERVDVIEQSGGIEDGARVVLRMGTPPFTVRWVAEHRDYIEGQQFRDVQVSGPFASWEHTHRVEPRDVESCELEDRIEYALPLGGIGSMVGGASVRARLERMFAYRHRVTQQDIAAHQRFKEVGSMRILVTGSSGLVGNALVSFLTTGGHQVVRLVRSGEKGEGAVHWDPAQGEIDGEALEGLDAVLHLAGENIASGRWDEAVKARIRDSRVNGTRLLAEALAARRRPPRVFVCASAIGFYGDRGAEVMTESSPAGTGFLPDVCRAWEDASQPAVEKGIRVVHLRIGVVLSAEGGALATMLTPFRLGLGGVVGSGEQYMSWIALDDVVGAIHHCVMSEALSGPVNAVAPQPVTNREYTKTLGSVLSRPTVFPLPAFAVRFAFGEMGEELLLSSTRVEAGKLTSSGYAYRFPELKQALQHLLGR
jgi:hypothetical protein